MAALLFGCDLVSLAQSGWTGRAVARSPMLLETMTSPEVKRLPLDKLIVIAPLGSFASISPSVLCNKARSMPSASPVFPCRKDAMRQK